MSDQAQALSTDVQMGMLQAANPKALVSQATDMAKELANVINTQSLFNEINGKKFVRVEGWTTLSAMLGCIPQEISNEKWDDGRYVATVELVRMSDQQVISRASAECGAPGENMWENADEYAKRSMAATRATSKACRLAFSWIMVLAGYQPTPAEEISGKAEQNVRGSDDTINFGKHRGKKWSEIESGYLKWCVENSNKDWIRNRAQQELDRRADGETQEGIVMAEEKQIRNIRDKLDEAQISIPEMLEMFELASTDQIRMIDVPVILEWIKDPSQKPTLRPF